MENKKLFSRFSLIAIIEGISFLVLLAAMPLKYLADIPQPVTVIGWLHGILFIAYLAIALEVNSAINKGLLWFTKAFVAAILPFGTFIFDRQFRKEQGI